MAGSHGGSAESMRPVVRDHISRELSRHRPRTMRDDEEVLELEWDAADSDYDNFLRMVEKLVSSMVKDLADTKEGLSLKVTYTKEDATGVELDFSTGSSGGGFKRLPFHDFVEKAMMRSFAGTQFSSDSNTCIILEMLFKQYLQMSPATKSNPTFVVDFPHVMARRLDDDAAPDPSGKRFDLVVMGVQVISFLSLGAKVGMTIRVADLSSILANLTAVQEVDAVLPTQWKGGLDESTQLQELPDMLEEARSKIDDWYNGGARQARSQRKVMYVLSLVGTRLTDFVRHRLGAKTGDEGIDVWRGSIAQVRRGLETAMTVCEKWLRITRDLTTIYWTEWEGGAHEDKRVVALCARCEEILRLRNVHEQLAQLLTKQELVEMKTTSAWDSFQGIEPFNIDSAAQPEWDRRVKAYEQRLEPIEQRAASALRSELQASGGSAGVQVVLQGFARYQDLLRRPNIRSELESKLDELLATLLERINGLHSEFEVRSRTVDSPEALVEDRRMQAGRNMPGTLNNLLWARQLRHKVEQILATSQSLLNGLTRYGAFEKKCQEFLMELKDHEDDSFKTWRTDVMQLIKRGAAEVSFQMQGSMMDIAKKDGKLVVNFSERMIQLIREVRQLQALGHAIPQDIIKVAQEALKFHRHATVLKQVANFYNSLDRQLIPSTLSMLEKYVSHFESTVRQRSKERQGVAWSNPTEAEGYIAQLHEATEVLTQENRRLRKYHSELQDLCLSLLNTDIVKNMDKWRQVLKEMRGKFEILARNEYKGMEPWRQHWDYQLYKAMEHQYQRGLETLNESLPEQQVSLCFKQGQIQFDPVFERIREQYYRQIRDFISVPMTFKGVADSPIFKQMPGRNEKGIVTVFQKAETLFGRLQKVKKKFREYVVLGNADLEAWVEQLSDVSHWEMNYKMLKAKSKEINSLDNVIKVDCFAISTAPIKATIEDHISKLHDLLTAALKKSAETHQKDIEKFVQEALQRLSEQPQSLEDIGKANRACQEMKDNKPTMESEMRKFETKNKLLKAVAGHTIDTSGLRSRWEQFDVHLEAHDKVIEQQKERMKSEVDSEKKKYFKELDSFMSHWQERKPKDISQLKDAAAVHEALKYIKERMEELEDFTKRGQSVTDQCQYFKMDEPDMENLRAIEADIRTMGETWQLYEQFQEAVDEIKKEDWITFRTKTFRFDDLCKDWTEKLKEIRVEKGSNDVMIFIQGKIDAWVATTPLLKFCQGHGWQEDHWGELYALTGIDRHNMTIDKLTFGHFLDRFDMISKNGQKLKGLHARAQGEVQIREALQELRAWALETEFQLTKVQTQSGRSVSLIKEWKDLMTGVGDLQSLLGSLKDSPYYKGFAAEAQSWEQKLTTLDEYLHLLNQIQRKWVYLEPIFARGALPAEQPRFKRVDKSFIDIMKDIEQDMRVIELAKRDLSNDLKSLLEQLDRCQKALNEFLEQKRDRFPRFYFIGDDDLLEILGQAQNASVIQNHLKKLFAGINKVKFDEKQENIVGVASLQGEQVALREHVQVTAEVEQWLSELDHAMRGTLRDLIWDCVKENDLIKFPSQILCLSQNIHFTSQIETAIQHRQLPEIKQHFLERLRQNTNFRADPGDQVSALKMKALVMDEIHNIDVVDQLIDMKVQDVEEWQWQKQLRFELGKGKEGTEYPCKALMVDAEFNYTFEYQGNAPKLVHTPLTDKCYLTLTQGMHLGYGGNPYGPAGTGKTESVKALGNALGRQVLVFNCDEGIDFKSMGRIFVGLVKCGAWGCFDEFNRLKEDQLSAISQMIQVIQAAIKNKEDECELLGRRIDVNGNAGIFVTLNPAGKGYGGRSKLPDNLKQLFRAVAMSVPDVNLIAETILLSEGFVHAKDLSRRIITVFTLSKQLLSPQQHYDWGLRAIKTVLSLAGSLVGNWRRDNLDKEQTVEMEQELCIQSLRVNTLSKLAHDDIRLFNGLINDIFPGAEIREIEYERLLPAIEEAIKDQKLQRLDGQIRKVLQLHEVLNQRMGVVIVGPSGSGKSTLLKILRAAYEKIKIRVPQHVMNPKAMPRHQLLGHMDPDTREWQDGVLTAAARKVVKEPTGFSEKDGGTRSWILCDGDIDPEWVESLNSVLDDNKLLTMPNGERIQFGPNVNFVFETHSLQYASPATVSRMGMIFLSEEDVDPHSAVKTWLDKQPEELQHGLRNWMDEYFYKAVQTLMNFKSLVVETTRMGIVATGLSQVAGSRSKSEFCVGLIRGLGSLLPMNAEAKDREDFASAIFQLMGERPPHGVKHLTNLKVGDGDKYVKYEEDPAGAQEVTLDDLSRGVMIQTVDVQRSLDILKGWMTPGHERPFLLVGPEGAGKSSLISTIVENGGLKGVRLAVINCSAQTEGTNVQQKLLQMCSRVSTNQGPALKPKDCERLVLLLKDINLPKPDRYGTVQVHSFLQQLVLYSGFYDHDLEWIRIERIQIVCTMNPTGGVGRYDLAPRFVAIISVLYVGYPDKESLNYVYSEFMHTLLSSEKLAKGTGGYGGGKGADIAKLMCTVYDQVKRKFTVDDASHYVFNPRDLTAWVLGLMRYDLENADLADVVFYEGLRLFADRLTRGDQRKKVEALLHEQLSSTLGFTRKGHVDDRFFTSWMSQSGSTTFQSVDYRDFKKMAKEALVQFSREHRDLDLVLLPEILAWITRVDRVLCCEGGSLLLTGRSGVGRRQIVSLCAYRRRMQMVELRMTQHFDMRAFKAEIKSVVTTAGVNGEHICLFVEDHNITNNGFLEILNSLLAGGEAPGLFSAEELTPLLQPLAEQASADGFLGGVYPYFVMRVRRYLHIAISMDPTNPQYEYRCQSNPSLFTRTSVLWMGTWSSSGMKRVPDAVCADVVKALQPKKEGEEERVVEASPSPQMSPEPKRVVFDLPGEAIKLHTAMGDEGTPRVFRQFLDNFQTVWKKKVTHFEDMRNRLRSGLSKLFESSQAVDVLKKGAEEKQVKLEEKESEANQALEEIQTKMLEAKNQSKDAEVLKEGLEGDKKSIAKRRDAIQSELGEIEPVLQAARDAVNGIKSEHLNEIRVLAMPPAAIRDVLEGVLCLMGIYDTSWGSMRKFLGQRGVKERILKFDAQEITSEVRENVSKLIESKPQSFKHEVISRASVAAAPLAAWVSANVKYSTILEKVTPLQEELSESERSLEKAEKKLQHTEKKIKKLQETVESLKKNFAKKTADAEKLRVDLQKTEQMLESAKSLIGQLGGENERWGQQLAGIDKEIEALPKQCLIASAFLTYLGKASEDTRVQKAAEWAEHLGLRQRFSFAHFMRREKDLLQYKSEGMPSDELSMQNAVLLLDAGQTPLLVDPASQATKWLKEHMTRRDDVSVDFTTPADDRFAHTLELAVRFGKTLIVSECDRIEPVLFPIMRRDLIATGPKKVVTIGDKQVDWQDTFKMYLVTRQPDLVLPPDASALVTEVNFSITREGLEGQLLGMTINSEQPELEKRKQENLEKEDNFKTELETLEEQLLYDLAKAEGSLLENKSLVDSLTKIKERASQISEAVSTLQRDMEQMDRERNLYAPFAKLGSKLFFLVADLPRVNHMYQFGLARFTKTFSAVLADDKDNTSTASEKIKSLSEMLLRKVFMYVSRGLFKGDRLLFGMHVVQGLATGGAGAYDSLQIFDPKEWDFFLSRVTAVEQDVRGDVPAWVAHDCHGNYLALKQELPSLEKKLDSQREADTWYKWVQSREPEIDMPTHLRDVTPFQRLLLVQAFRPDRLTSAMDTFVRSQLQVESLTPPEVGLGHYAASSSPGEAILMITTPGADPSLQVEEMAFNNPKVGRHNFVQIAMGGGQTDEAISQLRMCAASGRWLLLKNLHLVIDWVPILEKELNNLPAGTNADFRLWLTSEPHPKFPTVLATSSIKVTFEAPPGIKKSLLRTYDGWGQDYLSSKSETQCQILFNLAWFHGLVLERRTYIPQGWAKYYEFNPADLKSASDVIIAQSARGHPDWQTIYGVLENAIYGGRMDNDYDVRLLVAYLKMYFNDEMLSVDGRRARAISKGVIVPSSKKHADFMQVIHSLAEMDHPATFGLPPNADRTVMKTQVKLILTNLRKLRIAVDVSKLTREEWIDRIQPVTQQWEQMCRPHSDALSGHPPRPRDPAPIDGFVYNELVSALELVRTIEETMAGIDRVIRGTSLLTAELQSDAAHFIADTVPPRWEKFEGPESCHAFLRVLVNKAVALADRWFAKVGRGELLTAPLRLNELMRPQTFLNALRQETGRKTGMPLVALKLACSWDGRLQNCRLPVVIEGLSVQGARWGTQGLEELSTDDTSWSRMPNVTVGWVDQDLTDGSSYVGVPVYFTPSRETLLCELRVPCAQGDVDQWVLAGIALTLQG
eukprot:TRINITY_DN3342_c0_g5_i1.p1 TRINITY_DN3342_c0_g5~~TRINITY_DN3342_c0_g5_i1.p1  ORF type:complete len:4328 (+),score=2117.78 TRINITY_DN3342_c0_g5_i1:233-13216(+)